jgi:hypothetical protein
MADTVGNAVTIKGDINKLQLLHTAAGAGTLFNHILPMPEGADWYDWNCANWGTKWEALEITSELDGDTLTLGFETAWCCPTGIYLALINQGYEVDWQWENWEVEEDEDPIWTDAAGTVEGFRAINAALVAAVV